MSYFPNLSIFFLTALGGLPENSSTTVVRYKKFGFINTIWASLANRIRELSHMWPIGHNLPISDLVYAFRSGPLFFLIIQV